MNLKEASKMFIIYPRTRRALTVWEIAEIMSSLPLEVKLAARGIEYAIGTGRLNGEAQMFLNKANSYQQLKVLVSVVNADLSMADVARFLNRSLTN